MDSLKSKRELKEKRKREQNENVKRKLEKKGELPEEDEKKKRRDWFISYKFLPGTGFYGFGLYHMIGGFACTSAVRALGPQTERSRASARFALTTLTRHSMLGCGGS